MLSIATTLFIILQSLQVVLGASCDPSIVLPDVTGSDAEKLCRYRDVSTLYPLNAWRLIVGYGCYAYSSASRLNFTYPIGTCSVTAMNRTYAVPYSLYNNEISFTFDYTNEEYSKYIRESFSSDIFFEKWLECAEEGYDCCASQMNPDNLYPTDDRPCPAVWDAWSCYPSATADSVVEVPCPSHAYSSSTTVCTLYSQKTCLEDGTWNQTTDYQPCAIAPVYRKRHNFHVVVLYVSLALSLPAVVVFCSLPKLRVLRVILHRNLLIAIVARNVLSIAAKTVVILDELKTENSNNVMQDNSVACRVLAFFEGVSKNAIYATMLVDGYYLHKLIVRIFAQDPNIRVIYAIVAALSLVPTLIWATFKGLYNNEYCWMVEGSGYQWIVDGFRIAVLAINMILLVHIIAVLLLKLKQHTTASHAKSTLRATLFLMPLFGLHIILVSNRNIVGDTCFEEDIFYYVSYTMEGLQGVLVATCFCYLNTEVHRELKNAFRKLKIRTFEKFNVGSSLESNPRRRTDATYVRHSVAHPANRLPENVATLPETENKVTDWLARSQE